MIYIFIYLFLKEFGSGIDHDGEHLGPVTGPVLILTKFVCFVVNVVSVLINICLLL
jgi:hypothetical protein